jgi:hypothetical protein
MLKTEGLRLFHSGMSVVSVLHVEALGEIRDVGIASIIHSENRIEQK